MPMIKKPLFVAMAAALVLAGCGGDKGATTTTTATTASSVTKEIVAVVNGKNITREELDGVKAQLPGRGDDGQVLDQLIELKVLAQKARKDGLDKDPVIKAELERAAESILANHLVKNMLKDKTFTDEQMKAEYDDVIAKMPRKEEYKAAHILIEDEAKAREVEAQLANGGDFTALAKEHSSDPGSKEQGGDLGWFEANMMVPEFAQAVTALEPGKTTAEPVKSQFGWHIIKLDEKRQVPPPAFDAVKPQLTNMMRQKSVDTIIEEARKAAKVEIKLAPAAQPAAEADKPAATEAK